MCLIRIIFFHCQKKAKKSFLFKFFPKKLDRSLLLDPFEFTVNEKETGLIQTMNKIEENEKQKSRIKAPKKKNYFPDQTV